MLLGSLGFASAASAADGDGAVIFNPDLTPIGSELTYGPDSDPQYSFTTDTTDDDYWGLDGDGVPAHYNGAADLELGIPLGFEIELGGLTYDQVVVNSNGMLCLTSSTEPSTNLVSSPDFQCEFYESPAAVLSDPAYHAAGQSFAGFLVYTSDQNPSEDHPIDSPDDADDVNDSCLRGGYYFADADVCSSVFWGSTTYEGKQAFVATWYHDPSYDYDDRSNTYQALLVNEGNGDITVVYNYDQIQGEGYNLDSEWEDYAESDELPISEVCLAAYEGGDENDYTSIGVASFATGTTDGTHSVDLFAPECMNGLNPTIELDLVDGGSQALISNSMNSTVDGRYIFWITDGEPVLEPAIVPAEPVDEDVLPATGSDAALGALLATLFLGLGGFALARHRLTARSDN